jgi:hypothetical protein
MGFDPTGHWDWGWKERAALGTTVLVVGLALLLAAPSGGSSLAFGAIMLSSTSLATTGSALMLTGTIMVGDAVAVSISEANKKPTSRNQMQKQVESGRAPKEVDRVDGTHVNANNAQSHVHFKDGTALNQDGSISHESRGIPNITNSILKWLLNNGWSSPRF